jgi:truncated hemoglobin YjbI
MSREVLLAFLALALLLNLALLGVATLRSRRGLAPLGDRGRGRPAKRTWRAEPARRGSPPRAGARPPATPRPAPRLFVPAGAGNGSGRSAPAEPAARPGPAVTPSLPANARAMAAMLTTPARVEGPHEVPMAVADTAPAPAPPSSVEQESETESPHPKSRRTRGRRFVLPPLDEDQARSAAAIEAFLGGAPPPETTAERHQRRRHRARRPTGSPVPRTTMLVWLQGFGELDRAIGTSRASHVSNAFFDSLRRLARTTDEIREVGTGRVRVVIDADDAGASAYVERARASVQPWLELLTVPLRVETGARESTEVFPFAASRRVVGDH